MVHKTNRVKVLKYFQGLIIETNNFAFEVKVILGLETTFCYLGGLGGWVTGWIIWKYNQLSHQLGWVGAWAELGNMNKG